MTEKNFPLSGGGGGFFCRFDFRWIEKISEMHRTHIIRENEIYSKHNLTFNSQDTKLHSQQYQFAQKSAVDSL